MKPIEPIHESLNPTPVTGAYDVVVCGGGPAGWAAAVRAGREGARTLLVESHGFLGGVWTAGLLTWIIDHENKGGLMAELMGRLRAEGALVPEQNRLERAFDPEAMKYVLETMAAEAGVEIRLHTRAVSAVRDGARLTHAVFESKSGREAMQGAVFVDATGDGDLGALAGCGFDVGRPEDGGMQPMSLLATLGGIDPEAVKPYVESKGTPWHVPKDSLRTVMMAGGYEPSYRFPSLFPLGGGMHQIMANHLYGANGMDSGSLTRATLAGRREVHLMVKALRSQGGAFRNLRLLATAAQIGVREGRRIRGLASVDREHLVVGRMGPTDTCRVTFGVDIHSVDPKKDKGLGAGGVEKKPYGIPYEAQVARDVEGLLLAGRCISGDFYGHASYRVTGNAAALGEAAGLAAAMCAKGGLFPSRLDGNKVGEALGIR